MDGKQMMDEATGILRAQLTEADQKIRFLEHQLGMTNQQFTRWMAHLIFEHGEETEPGVWKLAITEEGAPDFEGDVAFQAEPSEEEKKLTFIILSEKSEKYAELQKARQEEMAQRQQIAVPKPKLVVEK